MGPVDAAPTFGCLPFIIKEYLGGFKCKVQHASVIEQEAGPWDWPEPERGLVAGSASSGFCAGGR